DLVARVQQLLQLLVGQAVEQRQRADVGQGHHSAAEHTVALHPPPDAADNAADNAAHYAERRMDAALGAAQNRGVRVLERGAQLQALVEYVDDARIGHGRLVLVSGEAGIGKSTLVERLEASVDDAQWYWGACDGLFTPRALGPLLDIAAALGG